jgi:hypothetical protein
MGFLKRRPGQQSEPPEADLSINVVPPQRSSRVSEPSPPEESAESPYANTACPTCGVEQDPLPKAKKKCRSCGNPIWVRGAPDGRRYLLAEGDLAAHEDRWDEHWRAKERQEAAQHNAEVAENSRRQLAEYASLEAVGVEILAGGGCATCAAHDRRKYRLKDAPPLPIPGCTELICRCDYAPLIAGV